MAENLLLVLLVVTALGFDFTNGFHDTANAMAMSISTGALRPRVAVLLSALLNVVGAFLSVAVAATIAHGIVDSGVVTPAVVFAGLIGAIIWNLLTWYFGIPSSSSHALIGGVVGATLVAAGPGAVLVGGLLGKVVLPALLAPMVAVAVATTLTALVLRATARVAESRRDRVCRAGQVGAASLVSLAHGTNDAQKTMGVITLGLIAHGSLPGGAHPPFWVIVSCALALGLGTALGGWRIIRTLGKGLTRIGPPQGFSADISSSGVILVSSYLSYPLSTTHIVTGSVVGTGLGSKLAIRDGEVRWGVAGRMVAAWGITLPAAGAVGGLAWLAAHLIGGVGGSIAVFTAMAAVALTLWVSSRRNPVNADNVNEEWTGGLAPAGAPSSAEDLALSLDQVALEAELVANGIDPSRPQPVTAA